MKIAIYHNLLSGGAKRALYEFSSRLCSRHQLDVFTLTSSNHDFADIRPFANQYRQYPFETGELYRSPLGRLNQIVRIRDLARIEQLSRRIAQDIDSGGYDVAFVHPCLLENIPSVLHFLQKTPSVFFCQEPLRLLYEEMPARPYDLQESSTRKFANRLDPLPGLFRRTLKNRDARNVRSAGRVLSNSDFIRQSIRRIYQVEAKVSRLGVDTRMFHQTNEPKQPFLLSVGSLTPLKGFDFLIRAIGCIPADRRLPLKIASNFQNPPERDYLTALAGSLGVQLILLDGISDDLLVSLYNQATLTVYAPVREPFGFVAIESMACGTPVVAVSEGGVRETVLDGKVGLLVERSEERFAAAIQRLLDQPELAAEYGRNAREYAASQWTWERSVEILENYLNEMVTR
jgi:glycosyltransferase involved in cell wall biosynthesis